MSDSRWWEYYAVRYFVGTVVGAGIVVFLNEHCTSPFHGLLSTVEKLKDAGPKDITVFASLGFAFCYIASSPIFTAHALREHIRFAQVRAHLLSWLIGLLASVATYLSWFSFSTAFASSHAALFVFVMVVIGQLILFLVALHNRFVDVQKFYWKLSGARSSQATQVTEYVESYRHLREHGNAFLIILLELCLAFVLANLGDRWFAIPVLFIWLVPAALCWILATVLESKFAHAPRE